MRSAGLEGLRRRRRAAGSPTFRVAVLCAASVLRCSAGAGDAEAAAEASEHRLVIVPDAHGDVEALREALGLAGIPGPPKAAFTTLVSLGDLFDRGPFGEECHQLLVDVAEAGEAAGVNKTVRLLGNHEWINLLGVDERDDPSTRNREDLFAQYVHSEELAHFGGWSGRRKALSRHGELGASLRSLGRIAAQEPPPPAGGCPQKRPPPLSEPSTLLMHAGITWGLARKFESTEAMATAAAADIAGEERGRLSESSLFNELTQDRHLARGHQSSPKVCQELDQILGHFCAARLVLGHTPNMDRRASIRCDGRLVLLDVAMSRWLMDMDRPEPTGNPASLEIRYRDGQVTSAMVRYGKGKGKEQPLPTGIEPRQDL